MGINETARTGPLLPTTPVTRVPVAQPAAATVDMSGGAAPATTPDFGTPASVDRLHAAGAAPSSSALPWDAVKAIKRGTDVLKEQLETQKTWSGRATTAAAVMSFTNNVGKASRAMDQMRNGDIVGGATNLAAASADGASAAITGVEALRGTNRYGMLALKLKLSGNVASTYSGIQRGLGELRDGDTVAGVTHLTGAAAGGVSAGVSVAGLIAGKGSGMAALSKTIAAPLGAVGAAADGVVSVERGISQMMHGDVKGGLMTAGKGALDATSGASYMASVIPSGSRALTVFGKAAGPLGAAAGAVAGGIEVYNALHTDPPNVEKAVLGGAKAAGSAMLMLPPPGNVAGGAILIGAALYENREAIADTATQAAHAVADEATHVAHAVAHEAEHVAHAVAHEAQHVAHEVKAAARTVTRTATRAVHAVEATVSHAATAVVNRASNAAHAVANTASHAAHAVADGAQTAMRNVGNFFSGL